MHEFTPQEIAMLAKQEREMDSGAQPFVRVAGCSVRCAMNTEDMKRFGLEQGQTITDVMFTAILRHRLADCEAALAYERRKKLEEEVLDA